MSSSLSPRPAPPNEQVSSRALHPIYQAVDARNYTKALKLTAPSQTHSEWDIVKALRVHALERSGKKRDALVLLWEVLTSNVAAADDPADVSPAKWEEVYSELFERMVELSDVEDVLNAPKGAGLDIQLISGIERLDRDSFSPLAMPERQDKVPTPTAAPLKSKSKGSKKGKGAKQPAKGKSSRSSVQFPPITDETVLQTLSVTLQIEGLHDTMSEIYHRATEYLSKSKPTENYLAVLEESIAVQYRAVSCCSTIGSIVKPQSGEVSPKFIQAQLSKLQTLQRATRYYDRIQSCSLQLAKATSQPLHFQWTAISSLWFKQSLQDYAGILEVIERAFRTAEEGKGEHSASITNLQRCLCEILSISDLEEVSTLISNANQKLALLPRLAESLSSRIVLNPSTQPSENDWDVYIETLLVQGKRSEAIEALHKIQCTPMPGSEDGAGDSSVMPRIDDEDTIHNHVGSMLPYTQRKKFERIARISYEMDRFDASAGYYKELLGAFPDQWSYWQGLIECCVTHGKNEVDDNGWTCCCEFTKEVIIRIEGTQKYALRGPHLCLLELTWLKTNQMKSEESMDALSRELRAYGDKFGPIASCCFADVRSYIDALLDTVCQNATTLDDLPLCVSGLLCWAKETHTANTQSASTDGNVDPKQRRKSLRRFIFGIQVVYGIASKLATVGSQIIDKFSPPITTLVVEWRMSLSYLPGVAPKDGGQKEVLPGDEIMLLASQALQYRAARKLPSEGTGNSLLQAAALLEEAIDHSPFNPHLKIAAIGVYAELNVAYRALALYEEMGIKQIQIDSCSYLILTVLVDGGLYTSAIKHSSSLLKLHCSASRDIKDFSVKALRNGLYFKANEMISFQRDKMRNSLQLLNSKGLTMNCAPLFMPADFSLGVTGGPREIAKGLPFRLGSDKGLVGGDEDAQRAERNAHDARSTFNAPSVILAPAQSSSADDFVASDNRDFTIGSFETIHKRRHPSLREVVADSLRVGHLHGFMTRAVLLVANANGPKKGKPPKLSAESAYHCESLDFCLRRVRELEGNAMSETAEALWRGSLSLGHIMMTLIRGTSDVGDNLASRESAAVSEIGAIVDLVEEATLEFRAFMKDRDGTDVGREVCNLLPSFVVPFYAMLGTTSRLFDMFSWGKRKRMTRPASGSLATLALSFRGLLTALCDGMERFRSTTHSSGSDLAEAITPEMMERVQREVRLSRDMTRDRVDPFFQEMIQELSTYDVET